MSSTWRTREEARFDLRFFLSLLDPKLWRL